MSAIELGPFYNKFVQCLKRWCEDVEPLVLGHESITPNEIPRNGEHAYLYKVTQEQQFVETVLKDMCVALLEKREKNV